MAGRREVNVNRPEHSWIPFYRELAGKLADPEENWRGRQGELAELMREMARDGDFGVPESVSRSRYPFMDPFTLFAAFNNSAKGQKKLLVIQRIRDFFGLKPEILHASYYTPEVVSVWIEFFGDYEKSEEHESDSEKHWDTFEFVLRNDPFAESTDRKELLRLLEASLGVYGVAISSLSAACYWVNPFNYLHYETINGIIGDEVIKPTDDAATYLREFERAIAIDERLFSEINDEIYLRDHDPLPHPKVWLVRGGRNEHAVSEFLAQSRVGIGFGLQDDSLSDQTTRDGIRSIYKERNPTANNQRVGQNAGQVANFILEMRVGDHVIMPDGDSLRCGAVVSKPYHKPGVAYENSRDVAWKEITVPKADLPGLPPRRTVAEVTGRVKDSFLVTIGHSYSMATDSEMPEDSWAPFHLELGRKLIEGEWWLEEKREELENRIDAIRWADPEDVGDDYQYDRWTGDPFSFYLSFNMRSMGSKRVPGYAKVKELFDLDSELPDVAHEAAGYGVHGEFGKRLSSAEIESFWEFYRLVQENDPLDDADVSSKFVDHFDNIVVPDRFVGLRNRKLSYWLYWVDPRRFIYIEQLAKLGILDELGLPADCGDGTGYLKALAAARELAVTNGLNLVSLGRWGKTREELGIEPTLDGGVDLPPYGVTDMLEDGLFFEPDELQRIIDRFEDKKNLILQGPPGVGKTFVSKRLAYALMGERADGRIVNVQFHQSYSYEEFVQGYRPAVNKRDELVFKLQKGAFLRLCEEADKDENEGKDYVMIIDEINRGNLSRVFGELLSMIEKDKRGDGFTVRLAGGNEFSVPENVYILGTMNLADRSLAGMDYAMRRRFAFVTLEPQFGKSVFEDWLRTRSVPAEMITRINDRMKALNEVIAGDSSLGRNFAVGHSYFCDIAEGGEEDWDGWYREIVETEIKPLLEEYWFDDLAKADGEVDKLLDGVG